MSLLNKVFTFSQYNIQYSYNCNLSKENKCKIGLEQLALRAHSQKLQSQTQVLLAGVEPRPSDRNSTPLSTRPL